MAASICWPFGYMKEKVAFGVFYLEAAKWKKSITISCLLTFGKRQGFRVVHVQECFLNQWYLHHKTHMGHHTHSVYVKIQSQFKVCGLCLGGWDRGKGTMLWDWKWRQSSVNQSENGYRWVNWGGHEPSLKHGGREGGRYKMEGWEEERDRESALLHFSGHSPVAVCLNLN